jgi:hypothetical protein
VVQDAGPLDPELPPTGASAIVPWLEAGLYKGWKCEPAPHPAAAGSAHSANRICSNAKLSGHGDGPYPVGAANVKELYTGANITGYAVMIKGPSSWYYYERLGASVVADGNDVPLCQGCHARAPKDSVYTQVK